MKGRIITAAFALTALVAAGCGSSNSSSSTSSAAASSTTSNTTKACAATIGIEGPFTGDVAVLGQEQLAFAKLAVDMDNKANGTNITLVQGDTQLDPAQATTVTQQFTSNSKMVAVVGPAGSQEVQAVGPLFGRAGMAFITGSATNPDLTTTGKNPTFFRVVSRDDVQGPQDAQYIVTHLKPKKLMIIDDQEVYSTGLVSAMIPVFKKAGIQVDHESVSQKVTDFSSLVAKVDPQTTVVVLPWQVAANAEQFGKNLAEQKKKATIFGTDGTQSSSFTIPGSYVSAFGPDINSIPADAAIASGREGRLSEVRDVRASGVRRHARDRRGDLVGVQERPDAEPRQRAGCRQGHQRGDFDSRTADQVRQSRRPDRRQVVPVQDQRQGSVQAGHQHLIS